MLSFIVRFLLLLDWEFLYQSVWNNSPGTMVSCYLTRHKNAHQSWGLLYTLSLQDAWWKLDGCGLTQQVLGATTVNFSRNVTDGCLKLIRVLNICSASSFNGYIHGRNRGSPCVSLNRLRPHRYIDNLSVPHRKPLLLIFAYLGAISATLFLLLPSSSVMWPVIGLLTCCANVGFGASIVAMNSYLPALARESKEVRQAWDDLVHYRLQPMAPEGEADSQETSFDSSAVTSELDEAYNTAISLSTSKISSFGIALGYTASIVLLSFTIIPVTMLHSSTFSLRLAIGMSGIWWAVMTIPAGVWLPSGAELKIVEGAVVNSHDTSPWRWSREVKGAWVRLGQMLRWREIKRLRNTFWYLASWFLLSDGKLFSYGLNLLFICLCQVLRLWHPLPSSSPKLLFTCLLPNLFWSAS